MLTYTNIHQCMLVYVSVCQCMLVYDNYFSLFQFILVFFIRVNGFPLTGKHYRTWACNGFLIQTICFLFLVLQENMELCQNHFCGALNNSPPTKKIHFLPRTRDFLRKRVCGRLQENVFNRANLFGGVLFLFPHLISQIQCLSALTVHFYTNNTKYSDHDAIHSTTKHHLITPKCYDFFHLNSFDPSSLTWAFRQ